MILVSFIDAESGEELKEHPAHRAQWLGQGCYRVAEGGTLIKETCGFVRVKVGDEEALLRPSDFPGRRVLVRQAAMMGWRSDTLLCDLGEAVNDLHAQGRRREVKQALHWRDFFKTNREK